MRLAAHIITAVSGYVSGAANTSLSGRALQDGAWACQTHDLRAFGEGKHRAVDDTPAGGGAGMVLRADAGLCRASIMTDNVKAG